MKNILKDTPETKLNARLFESLLFVEKKDIKGKKILDIGCGYGWFELHALENHVKEITGIEISNSDLTAAKKFINDKRAKFLVSGATKLPFKDNSFDTVVCWEVIEHIPKNTENIMFMEVNRVLTSKGKFYLSTPFDSVLSKVFDPAWWLIGHRHYSKEALTSFGKSNGFIVKTVNIKGRMICVLSSLNMYISKWIFRRRSLFEEYFIEKEKQEYKNKNGFYGIFVKYEKK